MSDLKRYPKTLSKMDVMHFVHEMNGHDDDDDPEKGPLPHWISRFKTYELSNVPISDLNVDVDAISETLVEEYARMNAEDSPPIVFDAVAQEIIDGNHRARASVLRGDKTIRAYVGRENNLDLSWNPKYEEENGDYYDFSP